MMFVHLLLASMTIKATHTFVIGALGGPWWKWKWRKYLFLEQPCIDILNQSINQWDEVCASASCKNDNQSHSERSARKRSAWTPLIAIWSYLFLFSSFGIEHHSLTPGLNTIASSLNVVPMNLNSSGCHLDTAFLTHHSKLLTLDRCHVNMLYVYFNDLMCSQFMETSTEKANKFEVKFYLVDQ